MNVQDTIKQRVSYASRLIHEYDHSYEESGARLQAEAERMVETLLACSDVLADQEALIRRLAEENLILSTKTIPELLADLAVEKRRNCVALGTVVDPAWK